MTKEETKKDVEIYFFRGRGVMIKDQLKVCFFRPIRVSNPTLSTSPSGGLACIRLFRYGLMIGLVFSLALCHGVSGLGCSNHLVPTKAKNSY